MKRFLIAVSSLIILLPSLSVAQTRPGGDRPGGARPPAHRPGGGHHRPVNRPGGGHHRPIGNRPGGGHHRPGVPVNRPGGGHHRPIGNRPGGGHHRPIPVNRPGGGHHRPIGNRPGGWHNRPGHGTFFYNGANRARYHGGFYRYPSGFAYRRWAFGQTLPFVFLSSTYYFTQYAALGLSGPPFGYQWVRYGPDLLLVDVHTGRISQVVYGAVY